MSPRRTAEEMADQTLSLVYIAGNVADAKKAEALLTEWRIDYVLSLEPFTTAFPLFQSAEYKGLFFYVLTGQHRFCRDLLKSNGLSDTVELDVEESSEAKHGS